MFGSKKKIKLAGIVATIIVNHQSQLKCVIGAKARKEFPGMAAHLQGNLRPEMMVASPTDRSTHHQGKESSSMIGKRVQKEGRIIIPAEVRLLLGPRLEGTSFSRM